jgi:hypothetical protein
MRFFASCHKREDMTGNRRTMGEQRVSVNCNGTDLPFREKCRMKAGEIVRVNPTRERNGSGRIASQQEEIKMKRWANLTGRPGSLLLNTDVTVVHSNKAEDHKLNAGMKDSAFQAGVAKSIRCESPMCSAATSSFDRIRVFLITSLYG